MGESEVGVHLKYAGAAVREGRMDVSEVAPSLMAMGHLCERLGAIAYGEEHRVKVEISAHIRTGSWDGLLFVTLPTMLALLGSASPNAKLIVEWVKKVIDILRSVSKSTEKPRLEVSGNETIINIESLTIALPNSIVNAITDESVNKSVRQMVRPLLADGFDSMTLHADDEPAEDGVSVEASDAGRIAASRTPALDEPETEEIETEQWLIVGKAALEHNLRWEMRLGEGHPLIHVQVIDDGFLRDVAERKISFAGGSVVRARLIYRQTMHSDGRLETTDYRVLKVLEVRHRDRQSDLFN